MWSRNLVSPSPLDFNTTFEFIYASPRVQHALSILPPPSTGVSDHEILKKEKAKQIFKSMYAEVDVKETRAALWMLRKVWRQMYEVRQLVASMSCFFHSHTHTYCYNH